MIAEHGRDDDSVFAAVAGVRTHDVDGRRAARLRTRCHAALRAEEERLAGHTPVWKRAVGAALAAAWCAVYLVEVIRRAATIYGF